MFTAEHPDRRFGRLWQRGYHDHVIKDPGELDRIREYIRSNVSTWKNDENHVPGHPEREIPTSGCCEPATRPESRA
jgi:hypothetical protein